MTRLTLLPATIAAPVGGRYHFGARRWRCGSFVRNGDRITSLAAELGDIDRKTPMRPDNHFKIASLTTPAGFPKKLGSICQPPKPRRR